MGMRIGLLSLADANIAALSSRRPWPGVSSRPKFQPRLRSRGHKPAKTPARGKKTAGTRKTKPKVVPMLKLEANEGTRCDLEKSWHGIHYLLTGSAWEGDPPLRFPRQWRDVR